MKSPVCFVIAGCFVLGHLSAASSQEPVQKYVPQNWEFNQATKAWECTLYFKTSPKAKDYQAHQLIYRQDDNWIYYRNVKKVIWCRALANPPKNQGEIWVVLPDKDKKYAAIEDIPANAWNRKAVHPRIPGWKGPNPAPLMILPPRIPNPV